MRRAVRAILDLFSAPLRRRDAGRRQPSAILPLGDPPPGALYDAWCLAPPHGLKPEEVFRVQAEERFLKGEALPTGWRFVRRIWAVPTGRTDEAGNREVVVKLAFEKPEDVRKAW